MCFIEYLKLTISKSKLVILPQNCLPDKWSPFQDRTSPVAQDKNPGMKPNFFLPSPTISPFLSCHVIISFLHPKYFCIFESIFFYPRHYTSYQAIIVSHLSLLLAFPQPAWQLEWSFQNHTRHQTHAPHSYRSWVPPDLVPATFWPHPVRLSSMSPSLSPRWVSFSSWNSSCSVCSKYSLYIECSFLPSLPKAKSPTHLSELNWKVHSSRKFS